LVLQENLDGANPVTERLWGGTSKKSPSRQRDIGKGLSHTKGLFMKKKELHYIFLYIVLIFILIYQYFAAIFPAKILGYFTVIIDKISCSNGKGLRVRF
jgi:hypothetical protein